MFFWEGVSFRKGFVGVSILDFPFQRELSGMPAKSGSESGFILLVKPSYLEIDRPVCARRPLNYSNGGSTTWRLPL